MKKLIVLGVLLLMLTGCQMNGVTSAPTNVKDITTYAEVIQDGKVEIDGITYDVQQINKTWFTYDDQGNVIEEITKNDEGESCTEYLYKEGVLDQMNKFDKGELRSATQYYYDGELLMKEKTVISNKFEHVTEYAYGDHYKQFTQYRPNGDVSFVTRAELNDNNQIISSSSTDADGTVTGTWTVEYNGDLQVQATNDAATFNYLYNNLGDKIMDYAIYKINGFQLRVTFYEYEYDDSMLPKTKTIFMASGQIEEDQIRIFE